MILKIRVNLILANINKKYILEIKMNFRVHFKPTKLEIKLTVKINNLQMDLKVNLQEDYLNIHKNHHSQLLKILQSVFQLQIID